MYRETGWRESKKSNKPREKKKGILTYRRFTFIRNTENLRCSRGFTIDVGFKNENKGNGFLFLFLFVCAVFVCVCVIDICFAVSEVKGTVLYRLFPLLPFNPKYNLAFVIY